MAKIKTKTLPSKSGFYRVILELPQAVPKEKIVENAKDIVQQFSELAGPNDPISMGAFYKTETDELGFPKEPAVGAPVMFGPEFEAQFFGREQADPAKFNFGGFATYTPDGVNITAISFYSVVWDDYNAPETLPATVTISETGEVLDESGNKIEGWPPRLGVLPALIPAIPFITKVGLFALKCIAILATAAGVVLLAIQTGKMIWKWISPYVETLQKGGQVLANAGTQAKKSLEDWGKKLQERTDTFFTYALYGGLGVAAVLLLLQLRKQKRKTNPKRAKSRRKQLEY